MHNLSADPLDILLKHDLWGSTRLLEICSTLTHDQFHRRFDIGPGSLHHTLAHMIGAMRRWADRIAERPLRPSFDPPVRPTPTPTGTPPADTKLHTPAELQSYLNDAAADLANIAAHVRATSGFASIIEAKLGPNTYTLSRGAAFVHICTHGTHHRAQCLNMLKHMGLPDLAKDLPEVGVTDWQAEVETGQLQRWQRRNPS